MTPAKTMDIQQHFLKMLHKHGVGIDFYGVTDNERRWTRIRAAIVGNKIEAVIFGRRADGAFENYQQAFERASGQKLEAQA